MKFVIKLLIVVVCYKIISVVSSMIVQINSRKCDGFSYCLASGYKMRVMLCHCADEGSAVMVSAKGSLSSFVMAGSAGALSFNVIFICARCNKGRLIDKAA